MHAQTGDRLVVDGHQVGSPSRSGEVLEVLAGRDAEHYRVRWDSGEVSIFFPQSDCRVESEHDIGRSGASDETLDLRTTSSGGRSHHIELWLVEDEHRTEARVTIQLREAAMTGFGEAHRHPNDPQVPMVGEELATARAMSDLAQQLFELAGYQIDRRAGRPVEHGR